MKTKIPLLLLALALSLTACGGLEGTGQILTQETTPPAPTEKAAPRLFTDDAGREVELPGSIDRIVPSSALSQTVLFAIVPEKLVGLASRWNDSAKGIIEARYLELPVFGSLYASADLNVEELALTAPQVILDIGQPKDTLSEDLDTLQAQTHIPVVYLSATLESMPETYRKLGALLGEEERGEELARFCERVYDRTLSIMDQVGEENKVRALYVTGEDGLNVVAKGSYHGELLDLLTDNAAVVENPSSKGIGNQVTMEQVMLWDPEFVLFAPDSIYDTVTERSPWDQMSAVRNGRYVKVPGAPLNWMGTPPSVQRYLGLIWLPTQLYPELCTYDAAAEIKEFYRLFYGCDLTEEQYDKVTAGAFLEG